MIETTYDDSSIYLRDINPKAFGKDERVPISLSYF